MTDPMRSRGGVGESWADVIAPVLARFEVAAAFGMTAEHNAVGADAVAKIMRQMAEKLDAAVAINDAALARAEKAEGERDLAEGEALSLAAKLGVSKARNRALEEGLGRQLEFVEAMETLKSAELREAVVFPIGDELRALLAPAQEDKP